jgi:hypothetical protein
MDEVWDLEERFWLAGIDHFQAEMHPDCIMAFAAPVGILTGPSIVASLQGAPRWSSVDLGERHVLRPMPDTVVVAYHARATRDGSPAYSAYCTSTYIRAQDGWRLVQHQQTPA